MSGEDNAQRRKRIAIIGVSTVLLVAMVVAVTLSVTLNRNGNDEDSKEDNKSHVSSSAKAVKTLCAPTDYQKECEDSLTAEAGNTTDPRELIQLAFQITIKRIGESIQKTDLLQEIENDPRSKMALDTCKQLMDLSVGEFTRSMEKLSKFDLNNLDNILTSLKVWLSGAITYQETCLDAFENTTSEASHKMQDILKTTMHMSSNGLAIITELAKTIGDLHVTKKRRLLHDMFGPDDPDLLGWYEHPGGVRRLLQDILGHDDPDLLAWSDEPVGGRKLLQLFGPDDPDLLGWYKYNNRTGGARRLLHTHGHKLKPNVVVAKDGSGKFKSINEALQNVPKKNQKPFIIYIKEGVYNEYVEVTKQMTHVVMIGDGGQKTRITGNKNFRDGVNTYRTPSIAVQGDYFVAINMGFENTAGPEGHQAVAIRVQADKAIFYKCSMDGYQDTLYAHAMRQYYRDCTISGTIDFVFGDAVAVFQNCTFLVRKPMKNQQCIVTAQGRKERHQPSGIVIQGGAIVSDPKYYPVRFDNKAYLARPWKKFSRTVFMDTYIEDLIQPDGYMPWQSPEGLTGMDTCFYAEFHNRGPGSNKSNRVKWQGVKNLTAQGATNFLPALFFHGDEWIKATKVPYYSGVTTTAKH